MTSAKRQSKIHELLPIGSKSRAKMRAQLDPRCAHGGREAQKKRKTARPFSSQAPTHLILNSKRAKGLWSLSHRKNKARVYSMIYAYGARFKVEVYRATVIGHQIHLLVKTSERKQLADFLRVLAGRVAITVTGAQKYIKRVGKFWESLCWSRLVRYGVDFFETRKLILNLSDEMPKKDLNPKWVKVSGEWLETLYRVNSYSLGAEKENVFSGIQK